MHPGVRVSLLVRNIIPPMVQPHVLHVRTNPQIHTIPGLVAGRTLVHGNVMMSTINLGHHVWPVKILERVHRDIVMVVRTITAGITVPVMFAMRIAV